MARAFCEPTLEQWAYMAGIIDGEGTFVTVKGVVQTNTNGHRHYRPSLRISQKDPSLVRWIHGVFQIGRVWSRRHTSGRGAGNLYWFWGLARNEDMKYFVSNCLPYLVVKKQQAEIVLELTKRPGFDKQAELAQALKDIKIVKEVIA